jgi:uncharacterized protein YjgD (DUF1641 family)
MAEPAESYPESATLGADERTDGEMPEALREALVDHDAHLAAAVESTDELVDVLTTAIIVAASADDEELEHVSDSASNLLDIADGLTTDEVAALTENLGEDADDVADLLTVAAALGASLSPSEVERLSSMVEDNGSDLVDALDVLLDLHEEGTLTDLLDLAETLSTLDIDDDTAEGLNTVLGAVGEAQRESEPLTLSGLFGDLRSADFRAGVGYLLSLLSALGRRVRDA